jgi:hypothetical protein
MFGGLGTFFLRASGINPSLRFPNADAMKVPSGASFALAISRGMAVSDVLEVINCNAGSTFQCGI